MLPNILNLIDFYQKDRKEAVKSVNRQDFFLKNPLLPTVQKTRLKLQLYLIEKHPVWIMQRCYVCLKMLTSLQKIFIKGINNLNLTPETYTMTALLGLFGRSPFAPLDVHMMKVSECVEHLIPLFDAIEKEDFSEVESIAKKISKLEYQADITKNDIRDHLPKTLFLPIDKSSLLDILSLTDSIADRAEDVAVLSTLKKIKILPYFKDELKEFIQMNLETFECAKRVIKEMHELIESSFGGSEAQKVSEMIDEVALLEHKTDLVQKKLLKSMINAENEMHYTTFFVWQKIFECLGNISDLSENLALKLRSTLELK